MASYSCFINPQRDYSDKKLADISPTGFQYGFPIYNPPLTIDKYEVIEPISRGFYGVTYIVKDRLDQYKVLKVIPKIVYEVFAKNFEQECKLHAGLANNSEHIVGINDMFEATIEFPNICTIDCHVCILDYVNGKTLQDVIDSEEMLDSTIIAQIAIDLFHLLYELENNQINHNDLHAGNLILKELDNKNKRADEINNYYKLIAIDLGSLSEESKSDNDRLGDIHRVSKYLRILSQKLIKYPDQINDNDYRLAYLLDEYASLLTAEIQNQTIIGFNDAIEAIRNAFLRTYSPWKAPIEFKNISDSYNAQTLQPFYVPELLVDPNNKWKNRICNRGPLLITGMRGCGKTMLLKALQFHARAVPMNTDEEKNKNILENRLKSETYIGLYVSSRKLLDKLGKDAEESLFEPFSRLFIAYTLEAIKTIRHLSDINPEFVVPNYYIHIKNALNNLLSNNDILDNVNSDISLENILINILFALNKGDDRYCIPMSPSNALPFLAEAIKNCSTIWQNHYILFLLDDVSTRYFHQKNIADLLSSLIFQSEICAFKITSEAQTIEVILNSPGLIAKARLGRDLDSFDLGNEVYDIIKEKGKKSGIRFIEEILIKRANISTNHPKGLKPSQLLGDNSLINIAKSICVSANATSEDKDLKNKIYFGISALEGFCVGDIGEVISLYDSMLRYYKNSYPIKSEDQSKCFRDISSIRLFQLNRTESNIKLKDYALSFAEAAHELLLNSHKFTPQKLRQYYSIYIKITSGSKEEQDKQFDKIIELIDAGIFVFAGGSINPRITSSDTNPIKQFILIYRKLYGITSLIGFQQADRFELSGDKLIHYLENPKKGKEILMSGLGNNGKEIEDPAKYKYKTLKGEQFRHTDLFITEEPEQSDEKNPILATIIKKKEPSVNILNKQIMSNSTFDNMILGLGFEDRALAEIQEILKSGFVVKKAICIKYKESGQSENIIKLLNEYKIPFHLISYDEFIAETFPQICNNNILCCASGLSKTLIFKCISNFYKFNNVVFAHTLANQYYPLDSDIEKYLEECDKSEFDYEFLEKMTSNLIKGEKGPYTVIQLHDSNSDESKKRVLITFSSAKYERLFKIIDERDYDIIELITPIPDNPRTKLAKIASEILSKRFNHIFVKELDTNNIEQLIGYIYNKYYNYYIQNNYNVEFALTGSKRQTIVCSILVTILKVSKCWYISPSSWDTNRFSKGAIETSFFEIISNDFVD
jgi:tRNA A-37 threonylcarbamoyl transferase component Bud32